MNERYDLDDSNLFQTSYDNAASFADEPLNKGRSAENAATDQNNLLCFSGLSNDLSVSQVSQDTVMTVVKGKSSLAITHETDKHVKGRGGSGLPHVSVPILEESKRANSIE